MPPDFDIFPHAPSTGRTGLELRTGPQVSSVQLEREIQELRARLDAEVAAIVGTHAQVPTAGVGMGFSEGLLQYGLLRLQERVAIS